MDLHIPNNAWILSKLEPKADVDPLNLIPCEDCEKRFYVKQVFAAHMSSMGRNWEITITILTLK